MFIVVKYKEKMQSKLMQRIQYKQYGNKIKHLKYNTKTTIKELPKLVLKFSTRVFY